MLGIEPKTINGYYYKPEPIFYGSGNRFFGIELEISGMGVDPYKAKEILKCGNTHKNEYIYIKFDGTVPMGMEIVSHPMTLDYHISKMRWQKVIDKCKELGYTPEECALHVHVNRTAFGKSETEQSSAIAKAVFFIERCWDVMLAFSRSTKKQAETWALNYGVSTFKDALQLMEHRNRHPRYMDVNLRYPNDIEFRTFRSTLDYHTFIATIQLVDSLVTMSLEMSDEDIEFLSWEPFVEMYCAKTELYEYIRACGL